MSDAFYFTISGRVYPKKTSQKIIIVRGRPMIVASSKARKWEKAAVRELKVQRREFGAAGALEDPMIDFPVNLAARIYRADRRRVDMINLLESICDALQKAGILKDDSLVRGFDNSRIIRRTAPRGWLPPDEEVEIALTRLDENKSWEV